MRLLGLLAECSPDSQIGTLAFLVTNMNAVKHFMAQLIIYIVIVICYI